MNSPCPQRRKNRETLTTKTVQSATLSLQCVDDIKRCDGLALSVLGVSDGIANDALEERLENTTGLLIYHCETVRLGMMTAGTL